MSSEQILNINVIYVKKILHIEKELNTRGKTKKISRYDFLF